MITNTYDQTLSYLYERLPMFQRIGAAAYKANLDNTIAICSHLGNPERKFKSIHIAGTNGKGSTSHMLASILQEASYKVGLYTSPHLKDFRERIKINGEMIPQNEIVQFVNKYKGVFEKIEPSFFEWTVGLAFDYFANEQVDIVVIEVGLGGRLDSTNVITPLVSVITNISYDHVNLLGNTLSEIATEKAGIIKDNTPVVIGESDVTEVVEVFTQKAIEHNSPICFADHIYKIKQNRLASNNLKTVRTIDLQSLSGNEFASYMALNLELLGSYQLKNIKMVISTIALLPKFKFSITEKHIRAGLLNVIANTGLMGRWQVISKSPLTVCDTGHNEAGIQEVLINIAQQQFEHLHIVLGMVSDKDITKILKLLANDNNAQNATYYFCKAAIPRALNAIELKQQAALYGLVGNEYASVQNALQAAQKQATTNDMIFIGGSTFTVAEVL